MSEHRAFTFSRGRDGGGRHEFEEGDEQAEPILTVRRRNTIILSFAKLATIALAICMLHAVCILIPWY